MIDTAVLKTHAPDLLSLAEPLTELRKVGAAEWSGACPFCGGVDRFSVQPNHDEPRWLCRGCTDGKWKDVIEFVQRRDNSTFIDACNLLFGDNVKIAVDPVDFERIRQERERSALERAELEEAGYQHNRQSLHDSGIAQEYHANLDKLGRRELWHERGLNDFFIDLYKLGYCPSFPFKDERHPTLTIPTWRAEVVTGLVHRALADTPSGGRYRPEQAGLGKTLFFADPNQSEINGKVLLLEGEIKTMVTFSRIYSEAPKEAHPLYTYELIGIAGASFKLAWVPEFELATEIVICLDPDATDKAEKIADALGRDRCRIVELPGKIDDLFIMSALDMDLLYRYLEDGI